MSHFGKGNKTILQGKIDRVKHLPEPDQEFQQSDLHERLQPIFDKLVEARIIEHVEDVDLSGPDGGKVVGIWSVREAHYEYVQDLLDDRDDTSPPALPCGDHGFVNVGDAIACKFDDCAGAWSKDELQHFWEHGELPNEHADTTGAVADD